MFFGDLKLLKNTMKQYKSKYSSKIATKLQFSALFFGINSNGNFCLALIVSKKMSRFWYPILFSFKFGILKK